MKYVTTKLIKKEDEERALNLAVRTAEHLLIVGEPGEGKSLLAERFFANFEGRLFKATLSKFSDETVLFGSLNIEELKKGMLVYNYENSLLDCEFAFIDEIFDASDVLLRSMLSVLNEREFRRGQFYVKCNLITAVATANYTRINEITKAVVDRFLLYVETQKLSREELEKLFDFNLEYTIEEKITLDELKEEQEKVNRIQFTENMKKVFLDLCSELSFSTRRTFKAIKVVKAEAAMNGREQVSAEDLLALRFLVMTDNREEIIEKLKEKTVIAQREYEQLEFIELLREEWRHIAGEHYDEEHLKKEAEIIRKLKAIDAVNETVAKEKDRLLKKYQEHYDEGLREYMKVRGLHA